MERLDSSAQLLDKSLGLLQSEPALRISPLFLWITLALLRSLVEIILELLEVLESVTSSYFPDPIVLGHLIQT